MNRIRTITGCAVALATTLTMTACSSSSKSGEKPAANCKPAHTGLTTINKGTLTVSAYVSPPYTVQKGSAIEGIDGLVVKQIAKLECLTLDIKSVAGAALPASVQSKRADLAIGGVYYSADRAKTFNLTVPMYRDGMSMLSKNGVSTLAGLSGKSIGVIQGYLWNAELQKALGSDHVKTYQTSAALIADIKNGRVGAGAFTSAESGYRAQADSSLKSELLAPTSQVTETKTKSDVVLLVTKSETALTTALNADIKTLLANGTVAKSLKTNGVPESLAATSP